MEIIYLKKEMVTENVLTNDGVLAYVALRILMDESAVLRGKERTTDCVSVNRLAYLLVGETDYDKALTDALVRGITELSAGNYIAIRKDLSNKNNYEYILDLETLYFTADGYNYSVNIMKSEVKKILTCEEVKFMSKRISMLRYFVVLVSTFDFRSSMKYIEGMPDLQGKISHMPQSYIAEQADTSSKSCHRYNEILVNMKMLYIYKSNDKIRKRDKLKQINNCYSRYEDRKLCEMYAANYENLYGSNHKIVYTQKKKAQADYNRKLGQLYNCIWAGYEYDENIIREVHKYIVNRNKNLLAKAEEAKSKGYTGEEYLEKLKDESVFEQFDFLKNDVSKSGNADYWGEPDPLEHDFSVEEILDMPTVNEVTSSDLDFETDKVGFNDLEDDNTGYWGEPDFTTEELFV